LLWGSGFSSSHDGSVGDAPVAPLFINLVHNSRGTASQALVSMTWCAVSSAGVPTSRRGPTDYVMQPSPRHSMLLQEIIGGLVRSRGMHLLRRFAAMTTIAPITQARLPPLWMG
jgi:hypothetical protein